MAGETTPSGSTSNSVQPSAPQSTEQVASQSIQSNTDRLGQVDVQGLVDSIKASSPDVQTQRDVAAAAAKQIEDRGVRREFVKALEDQGVARKPGFWERQWQGVKGTATGVYEGGASLVEGVYDLGKLGVQGTVATAKFGYNYATDGQYRAETNAALGRAADSTIDATKQGLTAAKDYAADRITDPSKLLDDAKTVDSAVRSGADAVAKKADQLYDRYDKARSEAVIQGTTDELAGKIVGRAGFEIGSLVVPVTKVGMLGKAAEGAELTAEASKVVKGAEAMSDASKVVTGVEVAGDAAKAVKGSEAAVDEARGRDAVTQAADRALVRAGDDANRVARAEQEARATSGASTEAGKDIASAEKAGAQGTGSTTGRELGATTRTAAEGVDDAARVSKGFDALAARRAELGLPPAGTADDAATLSRLQINGKSFDGINSGLQNPRTGIALDRVNAQTKTHAEAEAVQRALDAGLQGKAKRAEMWVDRDPCDSCGKFGGLRSLARNLGVDELVVHSPSGTQVFKPTK